MKSGANRRPDLRLWAVCALLAAAALAVRLPLLEPRPMHTDEAVHALLLGDMLAGKGYAYNPRDFHGPALYFLAEPLLRLMGVRSLAAMEAWHLRLVPALAWSALILLLPLLRSGLGNSGVVTAAALLLLAAPFCYFSTDFIHESLFVLAMIFSIAADWRWAETGKTLWAVLLGAGLGLMAATKETAALAFAAAAISLAFTARKALAQPRLLRSAALALAVALLVALAFFTSFGRNFGAVGDLAAAVGNFTARAGGQGHEKPWGTYLAWVFLPNPRAWPFGGWILGATFLLGAILARRRPLVRFLAGFTLALWVIYSLIPYKTPWLELGFLAPMALVGGAGIDALWTHRRWRLPLGAAAAVAALLLVHETKRLCEKFPADPLNPLAYAASSPDAARLAAKVAELAGKKDNAIVQVVSADSWPLPWYLRKLPRVGYWADPATPLAGDVVVLSQDAAAAHETPAGYHLVGMYGIRPEMLAFVYTRP